MKPGPGVEPVELGQDGPGVLTMRWSDGHASRFGVRRLRLSCRCAQCVDEWTNERRLDPAKVPLTIQPIRIEPVGRYGLQIEWNDGHGTGIYTFDVLGALCECEGCTTTAADKEKERS